MDDLQLFFFYYVQSSFCVSRENSNKLGGEDKEPRDLYAR